MWRDDDVHTRFDISHSNPETTLENQAGLFRIGERPLTSLSRDIIHSRVLSLSSRVRCISLLGPIISYDITSRPPFPPLRSGGTSLPHPCWFSFGLHLPRCRPDVDGVHVDFYLTVCPEQERDFLDGPWRFYRRAARTSSLCVYPSA